MKKYTKITQRLIVKFINLIEYLDDSTSQILTVLDNLNSNNKLEIEQKIYYQNGLRNINYRSRMLRKDIIDIMEEISTVQNNEELSGLIDNMNRRMNELFNFSQNIIDVNYYVDMMGKLKSKSRENFE